MTLQSACECALLCGKKGTRSATRGQHPSYYLILGIQTFLWPLRGLGIQHLVPAIGCVGQPPPEATQRL